LNEDLKYRLSMSGTATLLVKEKENVLTVPTDSLISRDDKSYVEVYVNNKKEQKEVGVGIQTDELAEIVSGLSEHDSVIIPK
jgi:macrolide-specific efflux system membrane fusion protein